MYGFPMQFTTHKGLRIVMRPFQENEAPDLAAGVSSAKVCRYIRLNGAQTPAQELEWIQNTANDKSVTAWAICLATCEHDHLGVPIGTSSLHVTGPHRATSGVVIYRDDLWDMGVASSCHMARCLYAQQILGLHGIDSAVIHGNGGSLKTLRRVGYEVVGTHLSEQMADGQLRHLDELTWVNPTRRVWDYFWGDNEIPAQFVEARKRSRAALKWARSNVTFL